MKLSKRVSKQSKLTTCNQNLMHSLQVVFFTASNTLSSTTFPPKDKGSFSNLSGFKRLNTNAVTLLSDGSAWRLSTIMLNHVSLQNINIPSNILTSSSSKPLHFNSVLNSSIDIDGLNSAVTVTINKHDKNQAANYKLLSTHFVVQLILTLQIVQIHHGLMDLQMSLQNLK